MDAEYESISEGELEDWLSDPSLSDDEKALLSLATCPKELPSGTQLDSHASDHGWRKHKSHFSTMLDGQPTLAIFKRNGYKLTSKGKQSVARIIAKASNKPVAQAVAHLRDVLPKISSDKVEDFVDEAIRGIEFGALRSAVILSWVGAVAVLQEHVSSSLLAEFNVEARKVKQNWKDAVNEAALRKMQEADFLVVICSMGIIDKNEKQRLEQALQLRNGCGHPSNLVPGQSEVEAHVEQLVTIVYSKFG